LSAATAGRSLYWKRDLKELKVDIFWDALRMNHDLDFRGRLELDDPTIPLPEMLLEKLQIVNINWKDIKDVIMLLREHEVSEEPADTEVIDTGYVADLLSRDWGFYYTATRNIEVIRQRMSEVNGLTEEDRAVVDRRLTELLRVIDAAPKPLKWRMRAKIGPKKIWYRPVDDMM
jgi:DNA-binding transcriptional MerR regulator